MGVSIGIYRDRPTLSRGRWGAVQGIPDGRLVRTGHPDPGPSGRLSHGESAPRLAVRPERVSELAARRHTKMPSNDLLHRTWRLVVTIGPLVAIVMSLAAGLKWR